MSKSTISTFQLFERLEFQHHRGARMTRHAMTIEEARRVVGGSTSEPFLSNMIKALRMHSWLNTPEEKARLEAALIVRRQLRKEARR